jgi:MoaA/NifB/PqqE/SkfB family radical SAM enzyme
MRLDEFKKIIDEVQDHVLLLVLWNWGEPLMNPELPQMIRYAADRGIRTVTSTNAHFLRNDQRVKDILSSGLSTIIVAIDSIHADTYRKYRKGGSLRKALKGLKKVVSIKRAIGSATTIVFRMVAMKQNENEVSNLKKLAWQMGADVFSVKTLNPICGEVGLDSEFAPINPEYQRLEYKPGTWERIPIDCPCAKPSLLATIFCDGTVVPCCYDFDGSMPVGNVLEQAFDEIWNGPAFIETRKKILNDRQDLLHCSRCLINYKHRDRGMFHSSVDFRELKTGPLWEAERRNEHSHGRRFAAAAGVIRAVFQLDRWVVAWHKYDANYLIWKKYKNRKIDRHEAMERIGDLYGVRKFFLLYPVYKLLKHFRQFVGNREIHPGEDL